MSTMRIRPPHCGSLHPAVYSVDRGSGAGDLPGVPEKTDSMSYGASNAYWYPFGAKRLLRHLPQTLANINVLVRSPSDCGYAIKDH